MSSSDHCGVSMISGFSGGGVESVIFGFSGGVSMVELNQWLGLVVADHCGKSAFGLQIGLADQCGGFGWP